jgi:hypothetical protein
LLNPWPIFTTGFLFLAVQDRNGKGAGRMRILLIGMMAATFVLGMGVLSLIFIFGRIVTEKV